MREGGGGWYYDSPSKKFCVTVAKHFIDNPFCVSKYFMHRKLLWIRGGRHGVPRIFVGNLLSHSTETFRRGTILCLRMFRLWKLLMHKSGSLQFFVEIVLYNSTETFRSGTLLCLRNFWYRKILWV